MKTVTRVSQRGTVAGVSKQRISEPGLSNFFLFFFFPLPLFKKKKRRERADVQRKGEHKVRPLHSCRSAAPSELKNKRILGSAPYFLTLAFLLHKTATLVPPLLGLQARSRSRILPGSSMHEEQAFSMHFMTSGLAGSQPRCSIALPSLSILTYF